MHSVFARSPVVAVGTTPRHAAGRRRANAPTRIAVSRANALGASTEDLRASSMTAAASRLRLATATPAGKRASHRYAARNLPIDA